MRSVVLSFILSTAALTSALRASAARMRTAPSGIEERESRPVRLGMNTLLWPFATHWAVQIDDTWFEVPGITKQDTNSKMDIKTSQGARSL